MKFRQIISLLQSIKIVNHKSLPLIYRNEFKMSTNNKLPPQWPDFQPQEIIVPKIDSYEQSIKDLKLRVNTKQPSYDDIKEVIRFSSIYGKHFFADHINKLKTERRKLFPKPQRMQKIDDYVKYVFMEVYELNNEFIPGMVNVRQKILNDLRIQMRWVDHYDAKLSEDEDMIQVLAPSSLSEVTLEDVQKLLLIKIEYIQNNSDRLQKIFDSFLRVLAQEDNQIYLGYENQAISIIFPDQMLEDMPEIDRGDMNHVINKHMFELKDEINKVEEVLQPLIDAYNKRYQEMQKTRLQNKISKRK